jgi:hypothetical protein
MSLNAFLDSLSPELGAALRPLVRTTQIPVLGPVVHGPSDQLAGAPWLPQGSEHPSCACCGKPLALFVQLRTNPIRSAFPGLPSGHLIQLFYCLDREGPCEVDAETWEAFNESTVGRLLRIADSGQLGHAVLPGQAILGWQPAHELPSPEELPSWLRDNLDGDTWMALGEFCHDGDKLGGWPGWIQGPELPSCRKCGSKMRFLFQVDSNCGVDHMFGDMGIAHLSYCEKHPEELGFGWACG